MESYSSDEEVIVEWNPITVRVKSEKPEPTKNKHRDSNQGHNEFFSPLASLSEKTSDTTNKMNISGSSNYFTPNESLRAEQSKNDLCLDALSKAIDGGTTKNFANDNTIGLMVKKEMHVPNLDEIQHSLVTNSMLLSNYDKRESIVEISDSDSDGVIILSDSTDDESSFHDHQLIVNKEKHILTYSENGNLYPSTNLCNSEENGYSFDSFENANDTASMNKKNRSQKKSFVEKLLSRDDNQEQGSSASKSSAKEHEDLSNELALSCEKLKIQDINLFSMQNQQFENYHVLSKIDEHPERSRNESTLFGIDELSTLNQNSETRPREHLSRTNSNSTCSLNFDDTLEEMEMALKMGLNYVMPSDKENVNPTTPTLASKPKSASPLPPFTLSKPHRRPNKFEHIQSPVADYIRTKTPTTNYFKVPQRPLKTKLPVTPDCNAKPQFQNVVSPVGLYIKNNPGGIFKQNIAATTVQSLNIERLSEISTPSNLQVEDLVIIKSIYRPATKRFITDHSDNAMSPNIRKLILGTKIEAHEKQTMKKRNETLINNQLMEADLTNVDFNLTNVSSNSDASFVVVKNVFIK